MKFVYLGIILAMLAGGYYEYNAQTETIAKHQQHIKKLKSQIADLETTVTASEAKKDGLTKDLTAAQLAVSDLNSELTRNNQLIDEAKKATETAQKSTADSASAKDQVDKQKDAILHPPVPTNNLGTIVTRDGKTYANCHLLKVEPKGIVVHSDSGVISIIHLFLPDNLQGKFGFDSRIPGDMRDSQVKFMESVRVEAGD